MASAQGRSDSRPGVSASAKAPRAGPSKWHDASSSQQNTSKPQPTTTPAKAPMDNTLDKDEKPSETMIDNTWDGFIIDRPTFPLSEIMALKRCNFSSAFYAYARLNGRTGVIARDLIEGTLEKCSPMPDIPSEPEEEQAESKTERKKSKGKGKARQRRNRQTTASPHADADTAANRDQADEFKIPGQTFEQVCEDLSKCFEGMDTSRHTQSERQQNRVCLDTIRAVSEIARELGKRPFAQHGASSSSSPSTPSAIDPKTYCDIPRPFPWAEHPYGRRLPFLAPSSREEDVQKKPSVKTAAKGLSEFDPV